MILLIKIDRSKGGVRLKIILRPPLGRSRIVGFSEYGAPSFFDLANYHCGVQSLRAHNHANHDRVATEQTIQRFSRLSARSPLTSSLLSAIKTIGLQQARRTHELVRVSPETQARSEATGA
jgi:hypothetical protein